MSLDLSLVLGAPAAFEYVLVHELCHLVHRDHSPAFWREVQARFPDWQSQRDYFHAEGRRLKAGRSEEHTSELQSLMRISYAVFCLKKKKYVTHKHTVDAFQSLIK